MHSSLPLLENLHPAVEQACRAGFEPADIESKLSEVVDEARRAQLRSQSRNLAARKVVLDTRYDRERLMCGSDDLLILYDCKREAMLDWLVRKDDERQRLTHFEEDAQNCLKVWSPVSGEKYQPTCAMLSSNTAILSSAIRRVLGPCPGDKFMSVVAVPAFSMWHLIRLSAKTCVFVG